MSKVKFTEEQQKELRNNKYTARVTANSLSFTKEFKELFYQEYQMGSIPRDILREHGYPAEWLGKRRIWGITHCIKKEYETFGDFCDIQNSRITPDEQEAALSEQQQIRQLQQKLDYLTQEVELKKNFLDQKYQKVGAVLMNDSSCIFEIIAQTVKSSTSSLSVKELCQIAGVSRSGYYAWVKPAPIRARQEQQDRKDFELVLEGYKMHGYSKGARGIRMALEHMEPPVIMNLKKIRRLMDKFNLSCPIRKANPYRRMEDQ